MLAGAAGDHRHDPPRRVGVVPAADARHVRGGAGSHQRSGLDAPGRIRHRGRRSVWPPSRPCWTASSGITTTPSSPALVGLMIGSLRVLWPWPDGVDTANLAGPPSGEWLGPLLLALVGFGVVMAISFVADKLGHHEGHSAHSDSPGRRVGFESVPLRHRRAPRRTIDDQAPQLGRALQDQDGRAHHDDHPRASGSRQPRCRVQHVLAGVRGRLHRPPHRLGHHCDVRAPVGRADAGRRGLCGQSLVLQPGGRRARTSTGTRNWYPPIRAGAPSTS